MPALTPAAPVDEELLVLVNLSVPAGEPTRVEVNVRLRTQVRLRIRLRVRVDSGGPAAGNSALFQCALFRERFAWPHPCTLKVVKRRRRVSPAPVYTLTEHSRFLRGREARLEALPSFPIAGALQARAA